jgi:hypothetical protein
MKLTCNEILKLDPEQILNSNFKSDFEKQSKYSEIFKTTIWLEQLFSTNESTDSARVWRSQIAEKK